MYLRLISNRELALKDERILIESTFRTSPFCLLKPIQKHPRGGYEVHVDCAPEDCNAIIELLEKNNLRGCI